MPSSEGLGLVRTADRRPYCIRVSVLSLPHWHLPGSVRSDELHQYVSHGSCKGSEQPALTWSQTRLPFKPLPRLHGRIVQQRHRRTCVEHLHPYDRGYCSPSPRLVLLPWPPDVMLRSAPFASTKQRATPAPRRASPARRPALVRARKNQRAAIGRLTRHRCLGHSVPRQLVQPQRRLGVPVLPHGECVHVWLLLLHVQHWLLQQRRPEHHASLHGYDVSRHAPTYEHAKHAHHA